MKLVKNLLSRSLRHDLMAWLWVTDSGSKYSKCRSEQGQTDCCEWWRKQDVLAVQRGCSLPSACLSLHELSLSPAAHQPGRWDPPQLPLLPQSFQREAGDPRLAGEDFPQGDVEVKANPGEDCRAPSSPCAKQSSFCTSALNALAAETCLETVSRMLLS